VPFHINIVLFCSLDCIANSNMKVNVLLPRSKKTSIKIFRSKANEEFCVKDSDNKFIKYKTVSTRRGS